VWFVQTGAAAALEKLVGFGKAFCLAVGCRGGTSQGLTGCETVGGHQLAAVGEGVNELWDAGG
jgi:hypothetical protein